MVLEARLELARGYPRKILSLVCLPIPPLEQDCRPAMRGKVTQNILLSTNESSCRMAENSSIGMN